MSEAVEAFTVVLIVANVIFSFRGFKDGRFLERYLFNVDGILRRREYYRLLTSGFLHANVPHLVFNMFALYSFSQGVGRVVGILDFVMIYFGSLVAGNILALQINRGIPEYRALGASGAVSGVIFASILMHPHGSIGFLFFPIGIPSWLFGIGFILVSIYGIRTGLGNLGHEAHLGGAIAGVVISILFEPRLLQARWWLAAVLILPAAVYLYIMVKRPELAGRGRRWRQ
jgi:membrane associated rhomboid family serine protease